MRLRSSSKRLESESIQAILRKRKAVCGSSTIRTCSPMSVIERSVKNNALAGKTASHHEVEK
jgi:hypothetical protein